MFYSVVEIMLIIVLIAAQPTHSSSYNITYSTFTYDTFYLLYKSDRKLVP